jgi:hypothetical protein
MEAPKGLLEDSALIGLGLEDAGERGPGLVEHGDQLLRGRVEDAEKLGAKDLHGRKIRQGDHLLLIEEVAVEDPATDRELA